MGQKQNRILPESEGNVLCMEIADRVSLDNYTNVLEPAVRKVVEKYGHFRILISYTEPAVGWDIDAAAQDLEAMAELGGKAEKIALINPPERVLIRWQTLRPLLSGELKFFTDAEFDKALSWVKS
ncbi:MAG: hypothetical protein DI586_07995 [Micavibrio aeruginosavorus]|uniref:STAS/SEC14 domain-containing protein n=1 Tax=Micavibrio aeruginosavorus TaxID=349221 RepID=A0A2W5FGM6_9BACT|nr:MAG: hypothetical protein DI586_07995 [Micavibrio aeruginosavorus]